MSQTTTPQIESKESTKLHENRSGDSTPPAQEEEVQEIHWRAIACLVAAFIGYVSNVFQLIATGVYVYEIGLGLDNLVDYVWIPNIGQVYISIVAPPLGLASDLYGRKTIILVALALGCVGSIVSSTAHSMGVCIAGGAIAGIVFAVQPLFTAITSEVLPRKYRPYAQAIIMVGGSLSGILGIYVGGAFIKFNTFNAGWRMLFGMSAIFYFIAFLCFALLYRPIHKRPDVSNISHHEGLMKIDWIGTFLLLAALLPFLMGLTWLNSPYEVNDPHVLAPLIIGCVFFVLFTLFQWKGRNDGILHHALFSKSRNYLIALVLLFVEGSVFFAFTIWWPQEYQLVFGTSAFATGVRYSAFFFCYGASAPIAAIFAVKWKEGKWLSVAGFVLFTAASIGMITVQPGSSGAAIGYAAVAGLAFSLPLMLIVTIAQLSVPGELMGLASANLLMSRGIGGSVGSAAYGSLYHGKLATKLPAYVADAVIPLGLPTTEIGALIGALTKGNIAAAESLPGVTGSIIGAAGSAIHKAFCDSFRLLWAIEIAFCGVALLLCLGLEPISKFMNHSIDAPAEELKHHEGKEMVA